MIRNRLSLSNVDDGGNVIDIEDSETPTKEVRTSSTADKVNIESKWKMWKSWRYILVFLLVLSLALYVFISLSIVDHKAGKNSGILFLIHELISLNFFVNCVYEGYGSNELTVVINTFKRVEMMEGAISHYSSCNIVRYIYVVWSEQAPPPKRIEEKYSNTKLPRVILYFFNITYN